MSILRFYLSVLVQSSSCSVSHLVKLMRPRSPHSDAVPRLTSKLRGTFQLPVHAPPATSPKTQSLPNTMGQGQKESRGKRSRGQGQSREVQISKAMSLLLRHAAEKEGLKMNAQGYANVADVVSPSIPTEHQSGKTISLLTSHPSCNGASSSP